MYEVGESWTDERPDDFRDEVYRRFDKVDSELQRLNDRVDGLHRTMIHGFVAMSGAIVASNAALIGFVATQV